METTLTLIEQDKTGRIVAQASGPEAVAALLAKFITPPLAGSPRKQVGKSGEGYAVCVGVFEGSTFLLECYSAEPDMFRPRGGNFAYSPTGPAIQTLAPTAWDGRDIPDYFLQWDHRRAGYYRAYFPDADSERGFFYVLGTKPDEVWHPKKKDTASADRDTPPAYNPEDYEPVRILAGLPNNAS